MGDLKLEDVMPSAMQAVLRLGDDPGSRGSIQNRSGSAWIDPQIDP